MILKFLLTLQIFFFYSRSTRSLENIAGSRFIDQANIRTVVRAGGISENLVGQLGMWWALVAHLCGVGLTNLPKSGGKVPPSGSAGPSCRKET